MLIEQVEVLVRAMGQLRHLQSPVRALNQVGRACDAIHLEVPTPVTRTSYQVKF